MAKTTHPHFKRRIRELIELGHSAPDIQKILEMETPEHLFDQIPTLRTIQRYVKQYGSLRGEKWQITDCDNPEDATIVLEALRVLTTWTPIARKNPTISKELANMVIAIKKAAPGLPPYTTINLASLYLLADATDDIHILLAFKPYENAYFYSAYVAYLKNLYGDTWKLHAFYKLTRHTFEDGKVEITPFWDFAPTFETSREIVEDDDLKPAPNPDL